jgi:hypothetical protein
LEKNVTALKVPFVISVFLILKAKYEPSSNVPVSQQEIDEVEFDAQPSGTCWTEHTKLDIYLLYSEATGKDSGNTLTETLQRNFEHLKIDSQSFPAVTKENFNFSPEAFESSIASCKMIVIMITKDALFLDTLIFSLHCAMYYSIPIVLVHDLGSCLFPNPAALPQAWRVFLILPK